MRGVRFNSIVIALVVPSVLAYCGRTANESWNHAEGGATQPKSVA